MSNQHHNSQKPQVGEPASAAPQGSVRPPSLRLPDVDCSRGAPMGRTPHATNPPQSPVSIFKVPLDEGGYDAGGAYWGIPDDLYCAQDEEGFSSFQRAASRDEVIASLGARFPGLQLAQREPDLSAFMAGYLVCAVWTDEERATETDGKWGDLTAADFAEEDLTKAEAECSKFLTENFHMLGRMEEQLAGHNFWLTRNGHGTGFWDRDILTKEQQDHLTKASHAFGERHVWSDGTHLHFE